MIARLWLKLRRRRPAAEPLRGSVQNIAIRPGAAVAIDRPVCSCPSGDGSLRWPCLAHPPKGGQS